MFKYKMTFPRTMLFLFLSSSLIIYVIKNFSEINILKLILSILIIGILTYISLSFIIKTIGEKKV
jgi:hypothetical protein